MLVFGIGPWIKLVVGLAAFQLVHLAVYTLNWFFFDEREITSHKSLTAREISELDLSVSQPLNPRFQSDASDE